MLASPQWILAFESNEVMCIDIIFISGEFKKATTNVT
jgi:hypothetical protein